MERDVEDRHQGSVLPISPLRDLRDEDTELPGGSSQALCSVGLQFEPCWWADPARAGAWVITPSGELDMATVPRLEAEMEGTVGAGAGVVIDLSAVTFMDCRVIGWLADCSLRLDDFEKDRLVVVIGHSGSVARWLFDLLDLVESIAIRSVATKVEALELVGSCEIAVAPTDPTTA